MPNRRLILSLPLALVIAACATTPPNAPVAGNDDARLNAFLDSAYDAQLALSPEAMTGDGLKTDYDKLDDESDAAAAQELALQQRQLGQLKAGFDPARLGPQGRLSYRLFEDQVLRAEVSNRWRGNRLPVTSNGSPLGSLPTFMINNHRVDTIDDARAYVARLVAMERKLGQIGERVRAQAAAGVIPARFNYAPVISNGRRAISGAPFDNGADSPMWADIKAKLAKLDAPDAEKAAVLAEARAALIGPVRRGYEGLIATMRRIEPRAAAEGGASRLPNGEAYYDAMLAQSTTTALTADQIHQTGLDEVARIQAQMREILARAGDKRTLPQLFEAMRKEPQFRYSNDEAGRQQYLANARAIIARVMGIAPKWFTGMPKAPLEVRAVEAYRQETASTAFYNRPAPDGSRPGIYYVNLADMGQVIKQQNAGISLHEGAPGHHFQIARAQELPGLPKFRTRGGYGAYAEGWGLYAESLGKEMGFYEDPYDDIGRLSLELWRAVRLVVDTGLHSKGWSRKKALDYFLANCLISRIDAAREIDRYVNNPGQATSYKIGQLRISALRARAEQALGAKFDIREFHEVVLGSGALPLDVLEEQVDAWIARRR